VTIYDKDGRATELPKMSKADIAKGILAEVSRMQKE
jgi:phosphopantothenoylcysteine decarboxylase/phosphopantothenate--cysteine ligase